MHGAEKILPCIEQRILDGRIDHRLRCKMNNRVKRTCCNDLSQLRIEDIHLDELHLRRQVLGKARRQIVQRRHALPLCEQQAHEMRADKACSSCHKNIQLLHLLNCSIIDQSTKRVNRAQRRIVYALLLPRRIPHGREARSALKPARQDSAAQHPARAAGAKTPPHPGNPSRAWNSSGARQASGTPPSVWL